MSSRSSHNNCIYLKVNESGIEPAQYSENKIKKCSNSESDDELLRDKVLRQVKKDVISAVIKYPNSQRYPIVNQVKQEYNVLCKEHSKQGDNHMSEDIPVNDKSMNESIPVVNMMCKVIDYYCTCFRSTSSYKAEGRYLSDFDMMLDDIHFYNKSWNKHYHGSDNTDYHYLLVNGKKIWLDKIPEYKDMIKEISTSFYEEMKALYDDINNTKDKSLHLWEDADLLNDIGVEANMINDVVGFASDSGFLKIYQKAANELVNKLHHVQDNVFVLPSSDEGKTTEDKQYISKFAYNLGGIVHSLMSLYEKQSGFINKSKGNIKRHENQIKKLEIKK